MEMEKQKEKTVFMHVVVFPWLAMGHLIPFFHLSKHIAQKGHKVSFISTPKNILRLPKLPSGSLINLVSLPLPHVDNLPHDAESSADVPYHHQQLLKRAFDLLELPLAHFLESASPVDWVVYDYASHWLPPLAARLRIPRAYFSCFNAACLAFVVPPLSLVNGDDGRSKAEDFTVVPPWITFDSDMAFRYHEVAKWHENVSVSGTPDTVRFGVAVRDSDVVLIRSSDEFEPEWFQLLREMYGKNVAVIPVGFLPPLVEQEKNNALKEWLDGQRVNSVVYVALGTEATLSQAELTELALGLELSGIPFLWVLRDPPRSTRSVSEMLPQGFLDRVQGRGMVHFGWASQVWVLSHNSVGGFLTHCGWNSMIEGLGFGRVLILFPMLNDQGLNARLVNGKGLGVEVTRNERDGSFTRDSVAESVKLAMVDVSGASIRTKVEEMKSVFGDRTKNDQLVDECISFLEKKDRRG